MDKSSATTGNGLTFPCEFVIKVFGIASDEFTTSILNIIKKHVPDLSNDAVQNRLSSDGKYNALSITIIAKSREELDAIYQELTSNPLVLMTL